LPGRHGGKRDETGGRCIAQKREKKYLANGVKTVPQLGKSLQEPRPDMAAAMSILCAMSLLREIFPALQL
jgi:hypothetical protein